MAEKTLNTRILLKYDTLANWQSSTLTLKTGELAIAVVGNSAIQNDNSLKGDAHSDKTPIVGIKVGDGSKTFSQLNWIQAIAGDVPAWAKESDWAQVKNAYNQAIADAISGLSTTGALKDLSNKVDGIAAGGTTNVGKVELITGITMKDGKVESYTTTPIKTDDIFLADGTTTLTTELNNITTELNKKAVATDVTSAIATAKGQAIAEATTLANNAQGNAEDYADEKIAELNNEDAAVTDQFVTAAVQTNGKVEVSRAAVTSALGIADSYNKSTNKIATVATVTNAVTNAINALDVTDAPVADQFVTAVSQNDGKVAVTRDDVTNVLGIADSYNKSTNKIATVATVTTAVGNVRNELLEDIGEITGAMRFRGTVAADPTTSAPSAPSDGMGAFRAGDVVINSANSKEFIYNGTAWEELGSEGVYAVKSEVDDAIEGLDDRVEALEADNTQNKADIAALVEADKAFATKTELSNAVDPLRTAVDTTLPNQISQAQEDAEKHADDLVNALNSTTSSGSGTFVSSVTQDKGKITVTKSNITLAHISDLVYASNDSANTAIAQKTYVDTKVANAIDGAGIPGQIDAKINALDSSVAATAEANNQVSVLTGITQTDGKLTAKTETKLAAIAKTGNVNDLIQTTGDVLIFDCGGSGVTA